MGRVLVWVGYVALCGLIVALTIQNRQLRTVNQQLQDQATYMSSGLAVGSHVARADTRQVGGGPIAIGGESSANTLLYFFSTRCHFCNASQPAIAQLARQAPDHGAMVVGVGLPPYNELPALVRSGKAPYSIVSDDDGRLRQAFAIQSTPTVLILDRSGTVTFKSVGQLDAATTAQINSALAGKFTNQRGAMP